MGERLFYCVALGAIGGLLIGLVGFGMFSALALLVCGCGILLVGKTRPLGLVAAAALAAAALGLLRSDFFLYAESQQTLPAHIGAMAVVEGAVINDPEKRATSLHANIAVATINGKEGSGIALAEFPLDTELGFGDAVRIRGVLQAPQTFETTGGRLFDYPGYLRVQGVSAVMSRAALAERTPSGFSLQGALFSMKHAFERSLGRLFPEPDNALLQGILLGERAGLPPELNDAFIRSSLIHVVVLSGYNISIISVAVLKALSFLPQALGLFLGGGAMVLFALMTGAGAATVRALIMALIALLARYLDRPSIAMRSLALAVAGMAAWNPLELFSDPSFTLSVLATFGLIAFSPAVERRLGFVPERLGLRSIAASTIAVQIFVLPALLYYTGILSFLALPANLLALPVVSAAMGFGFLAGMLGFLHAALGIFPGLVADLLLRWMMLVANTAAGFQWGALVVPAFSAWFAVLIYAPLTWLAVRAHRKNAHEARQARFVGVAAVATPPLAKTALPVPPN